MGETIYLGGTWRNWGPRNSECSFEIYYATTSEADAKEWLAKNPEAEVKVAASGDEWPSWDSL